MPSHHCLIGILLESTNNIWLNVESQHIVLPSWFLHQAFEKFPTHVLQRSCTTAVTDVRQRMEMLYICFKIFLTWYIWLWSDKPMMLIALIVGSCLFLCTNAWEEFVWPGINIFIWTDDYFYFVKRKEPEDLWFQLLKEILDWNFLLNGSIIDVPDGCADSL